MPPTIHSSLPLRLAQKATHTPISTAPDCQRRHASILSQLSDIKSSYNKRIRVGRGPSSGYGKTSGRGHKGQKQHGKVPHKFEGGQTPVWKIKGERGFVNKFSRDFAKVPLTKIQSWVAQGRLDPNKPITPRELMISKCVSNARDGIKLLATSRSHELSLDKQGPLTVPLNIIVSRASASAIAAVEQAGGTIMTRYYTKFAMDHILAGRMDPYRSLRSEPLESDEELKEYKYRLPDATSRKDIEYYRDEAKRGYLAYTVGEHEGPSLFHKPPRNITKEEIEERKRLRGKTSTGIDTRKAKLNVDANKMW